jgi:hypothetical protein
MPCGIYPFTTNDSSGCLVVTTDGGAGSSGKGSLNSWIADKYRFHLATNNWMTNAGHYTELDNGTRILVQHIPSAFVNPDTRLYINAGAAIDLKTLFGEVEKLEELGYQIRNRLTIHPLANVITEDNKQYERETIKTGSTFKGCGAAIAAKAMRLPKQKLVRDYEELREYCEIKDLTIELNEGIATKGMRVLVEGSQGVDLDLNFAEYPYCTSRQTHPTQLVADAGLPCRAVTNVIINLRTNPIRINNESAATGEHCYTGNYWEAKEIGWEDIAKQAGYDNYEEFLEEYKYAMMTSVTKKVRRIFEFPVERLKYVNALAGGLLQGGNVLYSLNFLNFVDRTVKGKTTVGDVLTPKITAWLRKNLMPVIEKNGSNDRTWHGLHWLRTGPKHSQIVEL